MQLEDYFDFLNEDTIRLHNQRVDIAHVLAYYHEGYSAEQILLELPSLSLEQIHATILYALHNPVTVAAYLDRRRAVAEQLMEAYDRQEPSALVQKIRTFRAQRTRK